MLRSLSNVRQFMAFLIFWFWKRFISKLDNGKVHLQCEPAYAIFNFLMTKTFYYKLSNGHWPSFFQCEHACGVLKILIAKRCCCKLSNGQVYFHCESAYLLLKILIPKMFYHKLNNCKAFSPLWIRMRFFRVSARENLLLHVEQ